MASFDPLILVEGLNLRQQEVLDEGLVDRLEALISSCVSSCYTTGIRKDQIVFTFPVDPSIESAATPVAFRISLMRRAVHLSITDKNRMARCIKNGTQAILNDRPKVLVLIYSLDLANIGIAIGG